jgi:hypothetical protein
MSGVTWEEGEFDPVPAVHHRSTATKNGRLFM